MVALTAREFFVYFAIKLLTTPSFASQRQSSALRNQTKACSLSVVVIISTKKFRVTEKTLRSIAPSIYDVAEAKRDSIFSLWF